MEDESGPYKYSLDELIDLLKRIMADVDKSQYENLDPIIKQSIDFIIGNDGDSSERPFPEFLKGMGIFSFNKWNFGFGRISIIFWIWGIILAVKAVKLFVLDYDWERKTIEKNNKKEGNGN